MKKLLLLCVMYLVAIAGFSQNETDSVKVEPKWKLSGVTGVNFSQTSLVNWSAGGSNAVAGNIYLNGDLVHKNGKWLWENHLATDYGLSRIQNEGLRKTADKFDFASKLGHQASEKWYYTGLFDFKTQFAKGYNYPNTDVYISDFLSPAFSTLSVGAEYKPCDKFSLYYSPLAAKFTIVMDDSLSTLGLFGVDPGKHLKAELGSYLKMGYKTQLMENVDLASVLSLFTAYNKSFGNIDVDWDVIVNMKINKYMNAMINTTLKYDDDIKYIDKNGVERGPRVQFKEILGIGLAYKF